jgi:hypothetical protein
LNFKIKNIKEVSDIDLKWKTVVDSTSYAWFWSEYYEHCFRIIVLKESDRFIEDESFLIYCDGELCGLAPLVFITSNDFNGKEAGYDKPLPWPMIMDSAKNKESIAEFIFNKIDEISRNYNIKKISLQYSPPRLENNFSKEFSPIIKEHKYINNSHMSHYVDISDLTLSNIRKRYKRYVKKYLPLYELKIIDKNNFDTSIPEAYMKLHIKDSGSFNRPLETYTAQFDYVVKGDGFVVQVINKKMDKIVGMLIICMCKNAAYDASVAVDPDFQQDYVSHLMKWKAIQYMVSIGVKYYELGKVAENSGYLEQLSSKNHGISFFKDGWSRGRSRRIFTYDKYFSRSALNVVWNNKLSKLIDYYNI